MDIHRSTNNKSKQKGLRRLREVDIILVPDTSIFLSFASLLIYSFNTNKILFIFFI